MCAGPPRVRVVAPGIRAGLDRDEAVAAVGVRERPPRAGEVRVERRRVLVALVDVAAGGVRLPDLEQRAADRAAVLVEHAPGDDDPLAERLARRPARVRSASARRDRVLAEDRRAQVVKLLREGQQDPRRRARDRRPVVGVEVRRVDLGHRAPFVARPRSAASSSSVGARVSRRSSATRNGQPVASTAALGVDARMHVREHELAVVAARLQQAEVGDDDGDAAAGGRAEVELLHERPRRLAQHHEHLPRGGRDLGRAAGAGQPHLRAVVVADHGAVEIAEAVDLRGAEEADVDAAALEPVGEHLRDGDDEVGRLRELAVADRQRQLRRLGADRAALVDEHGPRRVRRPREVRRERGQADPDEADVAVAQAPRRLHGHHLVRRPAHAARRLRWYSSMSRVARTWRSIHAANVSRSRLISSQRT